MDKVKIVAGVLHDECKKRWKNYSFSNDPHHENEHADLAKKIVESLENTSRD